MSVPISIGLAEARLDATRAYIDAGAGQAELRLYDASSVLVAAIGLANPCGVVSGGLLALSASDDALALVDGAPVAAAIVSAAGDACIAGLTVGAGGSGANVELSTTTLFAGGTVRLTGGVLG